MSQCQSGNDYDGKLGVRISAIFVILAGSLLGAWFPVYAVNHKGAGVPSWAFFIAKYFGSGVIVATAFIHLLAPATDALTDPCLTGPITDYDWAEGICLIVVFLMFFLELMTMRYAKFGHDHGHDIEHSAGGHLHPKKDDNRTGASTDSSQLTIAEPSVKQEDGSLGKHHGVTEGHEMDERQRRLSCSGPHVPGDDHLSHSRGHNATNTERSQHHDHGRTFDPESYAAQLTAIFILEFGVVFHSIFIGLTLAVAGKEFDTLYVVLAFHQTFEGLALGTRLASVEWPHHRKWTPYILAVGYGISTPTAIAIGLGVRTTFVPGSQGTLIINGIFDAISAGILIYTGLIELMAHEFMFSEYMQRAPIKEVLSAFGMMCLGAGCMALLGKWA